jgi:nucleoside-diphosphate-sugar epimerase
VRYFTLYHVQKFILKRLHRNNSGGPSFARSLDRPLWLQIEQHMVRANQSWTAGGALARSVRALVAERTRLKRRQKRMCRACNASKNNGMPALSQAASHSHHLAALPGMWVRKKHDFHIVNCLGTKAVIAAARERGVSRLLHCSTESILFSASSTDRFVAEHTCTTIEEMPGAYTRSKLIAEQCALEAAASGLHVVVANPTMPIGNDRNLTPPALMLQYFINRPIQFYLDFIVNLVDVQDVAEGLLLAMQRGRSGERYVLGGENLSLKKLLPVLGARPDRHRGRAFVAR